MSVKHAVLGLLLQRPSYPYELSVLFEERVGPAWEMNRGQIYQAIERLEQEGLIKCVGSKPNERGERRVYRVTKKGEEEFERWFMTRVEKVRPYRDDLIVKIALSRPKHARHLLESVTRQEQKCMERLKEYSEFSPPRVSIKEGGDWDSNWPFLILKGAAAHLHADVAWLREIRETLQELSARNGGSA